MCDSYNRLVLALHDVALQFNWVIKQHAGNLKGVSSRALVTGEGREGREGGGRERREASE